MSRLLVLSLVLGAGVILGRTFGGRYGRAEAAVGEVECAVENGDTNGDGSVDLSDAVNILDFLFRGTGEMAPLCGPPAAHCGLPTTGQTVCYGIVEGEHGPPVPCEGAEIPGQDGSYQASCPLEGRFVDHRDGTVTDACTGLMWQKDTADVNGDGTIDPEWGGTDAPSWRAALEYCEGLRFAGHDDWRLPNVRELQSIVDYGRHDPAIDPVFSALSAGYATSTTYTVNPGFAWIVRFDRGYVSLGEDKDGNYHVRAVRQGP